MNYKLLLCTLLLSITSLAQDKTIISLPKVKETSYTDFMFLKEPLKDKQIVLLGEYTHMYSSIFQTKAQLVEFLHKELGFTTFAMESPMYDIYKATQNGYDIPRLQNAIWGTWNTPEFTAVLEYIEQNNLNIIGFDNQIIDNHGFVEDFFDYLEKEKVSLKLDEDDFAIVIDGLIDNYKIDQSDISYPALQKQLEQIIKKLQAKSFTKENWLWIQFTKNVLAMARSANQPEEILLEHEFIGQDLNIRDAQMADNLLAYHDLFPKEKIIVWADNIHTMYQASQSDKPRNRSFQSTGDILKKSLGSNVYSIATLHGNDSIYDTQEKKWFSTPILEDSFEAIMLSNSQDQAFIFSKADFLKQPLYTRLLSFNKFNKENLSTLHDAYIFLNKATQKNQEYFVENTPVNQIVNTAQESAGDLKAPIKNRNIQIIDKTTQKPLEFVVVTISDDNLYYITDENGYFELDPVLLDSPSPLVNIQNMGYHSRHFQVQNLPSIIELDPNFQELQAIEINITLTPVQVLQRAIANRNKNYSKEAYNSLSENLIITTQNNKTLFDIAFITTEYTRNMQTLFAETSRLEQIYYKQKNDKRELKALDAFFPLRMNAVRYATILDKRKYKKYTLSFIQENNNALDNTYVIAFEAQRDKWNYTNKSYPATYSGRVYINKEDYGIVKVVENWESKLTAKEYKEYIQNTNNGEQIQENTIIEQQISTYVKEPHNSIYYWDKYAYRYYNKTTNDQKTAFETTIELKRSFSDIKTKQVEVFEFERNGWTKLVNSALDRVEYNEEFWDNYTIDPSLENIFN